ncbi:MAG: PilN domain-containing protein [candidate division Zixibacteria bacterium]|nr:PilN domain-containing protein [candidate division Zixibacteria bacterium]NIR63207.1 PilN domain-containing protein [candidate division Zixibacteria bacterium]NIS16905.1 PilN domain-containing protein [candidate division Zixibacteria bacterium]NIS45184.1 PilN domain-containing protein [candidate division Zixibacteria bacterium]NIT51757.1 PilN domain-containing protein [candidate division Zixibacteria bacterium]
MIEINLLPKEYRRRATPLHFNKKWLYAGAAVCLVFVLLAGMTFYKQQMIRNMDKKIVAAQKERMSLQKDIKLIDNLTNLKQNLLTRLSAIEKLDMDRGMWVAIMEDLSSRVPELLWLTNVSEEDLRQKAAEQRKANNPRNLGQAVQDTVEFQMPSRRPAVIEGYAYTLNSIASFLVGVMKSEYFDDIELAYARQENVEDLDAYNFKINCVVDYDAWLKEEYQPEVSVSSPLADQ